jgi:hypothetical protein
MIVKYTTEAGEVEFRHVDAFQTMKEEYGTIACAGDGDEYDNFWLKDGTAEVLSDGGQSLGVFDIKGMRKETTPPTKLRAVPDRAH